ncbi:MAG: vanadium-dependent haloperoxidase, partial [Acidobacteriota bacterium]|nr:vanadium-dependent haloperoxidase [Acidobacteriota bacterium]
ALKVLALRNNDGSELPDNVYIAGRAPGDHRTAPNDALQGYLGPRWGDVKPFCVSFTPAAGDPQGLNPYIGPPPGFSTAQYKNDFEEVRDRGGAVRNKRTPEQEVTGIYWAYDGAKRLGTPPRLYNQVVRKIVEDMSSMPSTGDLARLFALVHAGMADAGIVAWRAKYHYNFWRPAVGVREDDAGTGPTGLGTGSTAKGDPFWWPYGAPLSNQPGPGRTNFTPNFPAYPSGHATFGTTVFELVRKFFNVTNNSLTFKFVSDELDGKTVDVDGSVRTRIIREYTLNKAIKDNLESRVWLGVHWRFDGEGGKQAGEEVANQVFTGPCFP